MGRAPSILRKLKVDGIASRRDVGSLDNVGNVAGVPFGRQPHFGRVDFFIALRLNDDGNIMSADFGSHQFGAVNEFVTPGVVGCPG